MMKSACEWTMSFGEARGERRRSPIAIHIDRPAAATTPDHLKAPTVEISIAKDDHAIATCPTELLESARAPRAISRTMLRLHARLDDIDRSMREPSAASALSRAVTVVARARSRSRQGRSS